MSKRSPNRSRAHGRNYLRLLAHGWWKLCLTLTIAIALAQGVVLVITAITSGQARIVPALRDLGVLAAAHPLLFWSIAAIAILSALGSLVLEVVEWIQLANSVSRAMRSPEPLLEEPGDPPAAPGASWGISFGWRPEAIVKREPLPVVESAHGPLSKRAVTDLQDALAQSLSSPFYAVRMLQASGTYTPQPILLEALANQSPPSGRKRLRSWAN
jgi:hypothetical protein